MVGLAKRLLPSLDAIPISAIGLSPHAYKILHNSGFRSVAQLLRPTRAQQEALRKQSTPADLREISHKTRHFYRSYLAVKDILVASSPPSIQVTEALPVAEEPAAFVPVTEQGVEVTIGDVEPTPAAITLQATTAGTAEYERSPSPPRRSVKRRKVRETGLLWSRPELPLPETPSPLTPIEVELRRRLEQVEFIGELAIDQTQFKDWCKQVRKEAFRVGTPRPEMVPSALFVTLMVLTARYSEEEARDFWRPYARMVWGINEPSQSFQMQCRNRFRKAVAELSEQYDLAFPQRSAGDLVRPVYRHAIIPAYLETPFIEWLKARWRDVLKIPPEHLVAHLQQERSVDRLPPTLSRFINGSETAPAAADLIRTLAFAIRLYDEGESFDSLRTLLADNPVERSLWEAFATVLAEQKEQIKHQPRIQVEWVWSLETTEMMLRVRRFILHTEKTPDLVVWAAAGTAPDDIPFTNVYERLDPWRLADNEWLIDELLFPPEGLLPGQIALLAGDDSILWQQEIPPLPAGPIQFFRRSPQDAYVLPVDSNDVQVGRYVLACQAGVTLDGEPAANLLSLQPRTLPYLLKGRFAFAGDYEVTTPLMVQYGQQTLELDPAGASLSAEPPFIFGDMVPGLSPRVPPVFYERDIWLVIPGITGRQRLIERTSLWLRSQRGAFKRETLDKLDVEVDEEGAYWIPLLSLLAEEGGYYTLELRQGLRALLPAPLEFAHVPDLEVIPPFPQPEDAPVYTPIHLPVARVKGVAPGQIGNPAELDAVPDGEGWLSIKWRDVRSDCRLLLRINEQLIPLEWPVKRFSAWIEPMPANGYFTPEELETATFKAAGSPGDTQYFFVNIVGEQQQGQQVKLSAQGQFNCKLREHGLWDMIRHRPGGRIKVEATAFGHTWSLLVLQRYRELPHAQIVYEESEAALLVETGLTEVIPGPHTFFIYALTTVGERQYKRTQVTQLEPEHMVPYQLQAGSYRFEIRDKDGNVLTLPDLTFQVRRVKEARLNTTPPAEEPLFLSPRTLQEAHAALSWFIKKGEQALKPEHLWTLVTLPGSTLRDFEPEQLASLWLPLVRLRTAYDAESWEENYGLLPAWVVTSRPLQFAFNQGTAVVYPELALLRGRRGLGRTTLTFMDSSEQDVYVIWHPAGSDNAHVCVQFGMLPNGQTMATTHGTIPNLEPVYQCRHCKQFVSHPQYEAMEHRHDELSLADPIADLVDVLSNPILAKLTPYGLGGLQQHLRAPRGKIDRETILNDDAMIQRLQYSFAYQEAYDAWLQRYGEDTDACSQLNALLANTWWQRTAGALEHSLFTGSPNLPAAYAGAARLLNALGRRKRSPHRNFDRDLLLLALFARHVAHAQEGLTKTRHPFTGGEAHLKGLLSYARTYAPELSQWAFTWAELFFVHSLT